MRLAPDTVEVKKGSKGGLSSARSGFACPGFVPVPRLGQFYPAIFELLAFC